jgi:hypothetical protein
VRGPLLVKGGVIVRGEGSGINGTVIMDLRKCFPRRDFCWTSNRFRTETNPANPSWSGTFMVRGAWRTPYGNPIRITQAVPVGATWLHVSSTSSLKVGQSIMVRGKVTKAWLASVGNAQVAIGRPDSWQPGMQLNQLFQRNITRIVDGSTIVIDAPIFVRMGTSDMPADLLPLTSEPFKLGSLQ